jgi:hypothetical protein
MEFPAPLDEFEPLARFAKESNKIGKQPLRAKPNLFMPAPDGVMSTFRIVLLDHAQVIAIGKEFVGDPAGKPILAYAKIEARALKNQNLELVPTIDPHPRHVDVVGWSDDATNRHKAHVLANEARLVLNDPA